MCAHTVQGQPPHKHSLKPASPHTPSLAPPLQVGYMLMQQWVDAAVGRLLDGRAGPSAWVAETLDWATVAGPAAAAAAAGTAAAGAKVSPLAALMWRLNQMVNPQAVTEQLQVSFQGAAGEDTTLASLQKLLGMQQPTEGAAAAAGGRSGGALPLSVVEVQLLTGEQLARLAGYLQGSCALPWVQPSYQPSLKASLALATHR